MAMNTSNVIFDLYFTYFLFRNFQITSYNDISLKFGFYCFEYMLLNYSNDYITKDSSPSSFKIFSEFPISNYL